MAILSVNVDLTGTVGVDPRVVYINTNDSLATVTTAGYLNSIQGAGITLDAADLVALTYLSSGTPISEWFRLSFSGQIITMIPTANTITLPVTANNLASFSNTDGAIKDSGIIASHVIQTTSTAGQTISATTASATPGTIDSLSGVITGTNTTMTSGTLVGVRGEADGVGASGGSLYGVQGKVVPTGTLSSTATIAAVFGQFDVSTATINANQCAAIWGDWGTTGATATDLTKCRGVAFTNNTTNVLNAQDYRFGNATYLLELAGTAGTLNYYAAAGTGAGSAGNATHCAAQKVIAIEVNGVAAYIPVFTQNT